MKRDKEAVLARGGRKAALRLRPWRLLAAMVALALLPAPAVADIVGPALVNQDGSLHVAGRTVRLYGIYLPPTNRLCESQIRPARCGSRAVLALEFRIQSVVRCQQVRRNADRSVSAYCSVRGSGSVLSPPQDLGAYLITQGWALALPGAPFEYKALERIARVHGRGVWGFQVDSIQ